MGESLLHLGMVIVIASALLLLLFQQRAFLELHEGEEHGRNDTWLAEERGILADNFQLPLKIKLDHIVPEYWKTNDLKGLTAVITLSENPTSTQKKSIILGERTTISDFQIMLLESFGQAFYLQMTDTTGKINRIILMILSPKKPDRTGNEEITIDENGDHLIGSYYADIDKKTFYSRQPLLTLSVKDQMGKVLSKEISFRKGDTRQVGPYKISFIKTSYWAGFVFMRTHGMLGIYLGFACIAIGTFLIFFTIPREIIIKSEGNNDISFSWKAYKFEQFYQDEYKQLTNGYKNI